MKERTILIEGHSKTYAMTGWRLGYGIAPQEIADKITRLTINSNSCTATFTQLAGIEALTGPQTFVTEMVTEFQKRRDAMWMDSMQLTASVVSNLSVIYMCFPT